MSFFKNRKARKAAQELLRHASHVRNMREDILDSQQLDNLNAAIRALKDTVKSGAAAEAVEARITELTEMLHKVAPVAKGGGLRENFEILVVAIAVAMGVRSYFIQPFKIPTGSMQPTLYGIHSVEKAAPSLMDHFPLKQLKFITIGKLYVEKRAKADGVLLPVPHKVAPKSESSWDHILPLKLIKLLTTGEWFDPYDPSSQYCMVGTEWHKLPKDAYTRSELNVQPGTHIKKGDLIWSGTITRGDHVFVNKVVWNLRKPKRGEIMVFSTTGINGLQQGTHYIKRMCGVPNDRLAIHPPHLIVNETVVTEPETIARIARQDPGYDGYQLGGKLSVPNLVWPLKADEYFALGDNTGNSLDSRFWGPVPERNLVGPAVIVYWPVSLRWGIAN